MKKVFKVLMMVLLGLFAGVGTMWATHIGESNGGYTPEQAVTYGFWAKLTAKPATTTNGTGKVFVVADYNYEFDPEAGDYATQKSDEDWSDIYLASSFMNADVSFRAYAKSDDGSYFTGWSFTDGYTDLGTTSHSFSVEVTPSAKAGKTNIREYYLYAAFLPVQLVSYQMVSGSQEVTDDGNGNWTCTQTIMFRAETPNGWALSGSDDVRHFKLPVVTKKAGTIGTWSVGVSEWTNSNISFHGDYAELTIPVTFTAPNGDVADYAATLTLETYAGVKMTAYLYARRTVSGAEAIRYNKSKVQQEAGDLTDLLAHAAANDIIKLNGNYSDAVEINKNITFDLNGYTLSNTLTVSGGNVTLAYSPFGGSADALNVTGGKAILNGGTFGSLTIGASGTVEQNGATISGLATNNGSLTTTDGKFEAGLSSSKTLVVNGGTFQGGTFDDDNIAINITGGTAQIKKGSITGGTYGIQSAGATTIEKLASVYGYTKAMKCTGGSLTVNNGKFYDPMDLIVDDPEGTFTFNAGYFQMNGTEAPTAFGKQIWRNTAGAEARAGYAFFAGSQEAAQASNVSVCRIGHTSYNSLEDALAYANNNPSEGVIIIMENDYTLPAGYYTIPAKATLIVPMSNDQETANPVVPRESSGSPAPVCFRKLIFENGVNMEVAGTLELTCTQYGTGETMGIPGGNYGHLILKPGSHMTINKGGYLRAWGFVSGDGTKDAEGNYLSGEIDVRRGGTVHEMFQMGDWKGGDISFTIAMEVPGMTNWRDLAHLFPIYMYFIQNVESPVKYHPGSSLICATSVNVAGSINAYANDIKVVGKVGEPAMFLMDEMADAENTWVRKYYDAKKDQQVYEVNSGAQLGSMVIDLGELPGAALGASGTFKLILDSRKFVLPLTSNFKIHLLSGNMQFTQSTSCLPGMEVEIDKESEVAIVKNSDNTVVSGALYFYDADQWSFQNSQAKGYVGNSGKFGAIVRYSPTWDLGTNGATKQPNVRNISSPATIGDAILNVHGTFRMADGCSVYTTWSKNMETFQLDESRTGGASVISTDEDAGTFIYGADAPAFDGIHMSGTNITGFGPNVIVNYDHNDYGLGTQYPVQIPTVLHQSTPTRVFGFELCSSVKLKNGDGTFVSTEGTRANTSYCYRDGRWTTMQVAEDECFMKEIVGGQTTYYAKPAEYIAIVASEDESGDLVGNDDHTYSDKAGAGRLFILVRGANYDKCDWWEVEKVGNLYHCVHPDNDTYYYWDEEDELWKEQRFTITWKNWDGEEIKSYTYDAVTGNPEEVIYSVTYGTMAEFLGSNPTREENIDYTYDFTGWSPELGPVTSDVTYTATYKEQPRKYTIIFTEEGGAEIERQFLLHNDVPVCENTPTRTGFTLQWEPEVAAVTGDVTYRATWLEEPPTEYLVTFFDYNGTTELKKGKVAVGDMPVAPANPSNKPATSEFTYVFDHWSPALEAVSATSVKSYTAVYRQVDRKYTIKYYKENGTTLLASESLVYGATPTPPAVTKEDPAAGHTYTLVWKTLDETGNIQTVMGDASYKPTYLDELNKYAVTVKSNPSGACSFTGVGMYEYNSTATITLAVNSGYTFNGWSDGLEGTNTSRTITVTEDKELVANFIVDDPDYTITWKNEAGTQILAEVGQKSGTATTYTGPKPTKAETVQSTFNFDGWTTEADGKGTYYKNGLTPTATANATYYAHFAEVTKLNLEIPSEGSVTLEAPISRQNLVVSSNGEQSGELINASNLTVTGNAYFDLNINAQAKTWYAVAVPWQVDVASGILVNGGRKIINSDFYLLEYNSAERATNGPSSDCWTFLSSNTTMEPGKLYMIYMTKAATTIRFKKKTGASILTDQLSVQEYASATETDANWNGIANPALYHAYLNAGSETYGEANYGQRYLPGDDRYEPVNMKNTEFIVGQPIFVQVVDGKTVIAETNNGSFSAPVRKAKVDNSYYEVQISNGERYSDRIYIQSMEDKEDRYKIALDLSKAGTSSKVAQMWVNRYDTKLCVNTTAPVGTSAMYPLGIQVPTDGEYQIYSVTEMQSGQELYVTLNGHAIWNLAFGPYTASLKKGTHNQYGLKLVQKAPAITTGVENAEEVNGANGVRKVLIDNTIYIIRDGAVYTINGQQVK